MVGLLLMCFFSYVFYFRCLIQHFQQYSSYIVAVCFICGGNRRKPHTCHKSLTNFITWCCNVDKYMHVRIFVGFCVIPHFSEDMEVQNARKGSLVYGGYKISVTCKSGSRLNTSSPIMQCINGHWDTFPKCIPGIITKSLFTIKYCALYDLYINFP